MRNREIEDLVGETTILPALSQMLGTDIELTEEDCATPLLTKQIRAAAARLNFNLPEGWTEELARRISLTWVTMEPVSVPGDVLDRASNLFKEINKRVSLLAKE